MNGREPNLAVLSFFFLIFFLVLIRAEVIRLLERELGAALIDACTPACRWAKVPSI